MQLAVPTEAQNSVYPTSPAPTDQSGWTSWFASTNWFSSFVQTSPPSPYATPIADNIIALIVRPQDPSAIPPDQTSNYIYDTTQGTAYPQSATANQLPPVVQVTMVAIDETSASHLQNGSMPPAAVITALTGLFTNPANYSTDMAKLQGSLNDAHITYHVFSSAVPILESKWSK